MTTPTYTTPAPLQGQAASPTLGFNSGGPVPYVNTAASKGINYQPVDAASYNDPNATAIQQQIAGLTGGVGLNYNSQAGQTQLNPASQYGASQIAPLMMLSNNGTTVNTGIQNQNATASQTAINNLNNIAAGNGPNAATIAASQQAQQNQAAQMAAIASSGGNPALAMRNAANSAAAQQQQGAANAVLGSANEQLGAQGTLQSALNAQTVSGQAIPLAQAQLTQQAQIANQGVQSTGALTQAAQNQAAAAANAGALNTTNLQQGTMNQQVALQNVQNAAQQGTLQTQQANAALNAGMQQNSYDVGLNEAASAAEQGNQATVAGLLSNQAIQNQAQTNQIIGSAAGGVGALGAGLATSSDRRLKTNIKTANRDINIFFKKFANIEVRQYA